MSYHNIVRRTSINFVAIFPEETENFFVGSKKFSQNIVAHILHQLSQVSSTAGPVGGMQTTFQMQKKSNCLTLKEADGEKVCHAKIDLKFRFKADNLGLLEMKSITPSPEFNWNWCLYYRGGKVKSTSLQF